MEGRVALIFPEAIAASTVSSGLGIPCPTRLWQSMQSIRRVVSLDLSRSTAALASVSTDAKAAVDRLKSSETTRRMDCIDCHNRVGHGIPSPDETVDAAIASGKISATLPYIKREGVALLNGNYPSLQAADTAIAGLRSTYAAKYPLVARAQGGQVTAAIDELKTEYALIATPAMKVQARTYPDNLGHQTSLGCFRCHDGAHYLVVKGQVTNKTIPSACSTCHTFPQVSASASRFPLADKPAGSSLAVSYTHLRAHETVLDLVC